MVQLRPYQIDLITQLREKLVYHAQTSDKVGIIAQAPTGAGKSKIFIAIAQMAAATGTTTLIITEATKIFAQIAKEYPSININPSSRITFIRKGSTYIAMAQTLARRKQLIEQFNALGNNLLIINDEAHIGTATTLLKQLPKAFLVGFTATPAWKWAKHLTDLYVDIVTSLQVRELVEQRFLTPYKHFARVAADLDNLQIQRGEFTEESQHLAFESDKVYDTLRDDLTTLSFKKCVVFTSSISHCENLARAMKMRGVKCVTVHSMQEASQNSYNMREFTELQSDTHVCISVGTLTKGFDFPPIDLVVLMRATTSLPLYLQMIGRGSRIFDNKHLFTTLDYGANYKRHGLWSDDRDWASLWQPSKQRTRDAVASIKNCPACEYIMPSSKMICPNCGHIMPKDSRPKEDFDTKLVDITSLIKGKHIGDLDATHLAQAAQSSVVKKSYAIRVAKAKEQQQPGYLQEFARAMGYKPQWVQHQEIPPEPIEFYNKRLGAVS